MKLRCRPGAIGLRASCPPHRRSRAPDHRREAALRLLWLCVPSVSLPHLCSVPSSLSCACVASCVMPVSRRRRFCCSTRPSPSAKAAPAAAGARAWPAVSFRVGIDVLCACLCRASRVSCSRAALLLLLRAAQPTARVESRGAFFFFLSGRGPRWLRPPCGALSDLGTNFETESSRSPL